jgi:hypothetical protein
MAYWEVLHGILQEEDVLERDRFFMYWAHTVLNGLLPFMTWPSH